MTTSHYEKVTQLQRLAFKHIPALRELALANCGGVEKRDSLKRFLAALSEEQLRFLVTQQLRLVAQEDPWAADAKFLMEVMLATYERRRWVPGGCLPDRLHAGLARRRVQHSVMSLHVGRGPGGQAEQGQVPAAWCTGVWCPVCCAVLRC